MELTYLQGLFYLFQFTFQDILLFEVKVKMAPCSPFHFQKLTGLADESCFDAGQRRVFSTIPEALE